MKDILHQLFEHQTLDYSKAKNILTDIAKGIYNQSQVTAFLSAYQMRSITVQELSGFRDALLDLSLPIDLSEFDPIDLCGTGGDRKNTFNISTLASFVVAGAGIKVSKHGNYGVSSSCGSSNVMEHFGYQFTNEESILRKQIEEAGICFLHAPLFHPAMKFVAPIRRELGIKTFFNMLGPMVNPSQPKKQIVGVYSLELARLYNYLYQQTDHAYYIIHSLDGYDEISLTGKFKLISADKEQILSPDDLHLNTILPHEIYGGDTIEESAKIFMDVLNNNTTQAHKNVVVANAGFAIHCAKPELSLADSFQMARESIESGNALSCFKTLIK
ncbi:MAG: anthranilate phosphoribosyltransferase [Bacteroidetes bacterium HGW-Bacteroidetes-17]|jgi:anthranilate phosphoribosyltransferase|nr:MAG: anthranilate phosphoribosyltransferase [Bacteroidetes bacterium HGW-Bacteroidetes-17]